MLKAIVAIAIVTVLIIALIKSRKRDDKKSCGGPVDMTGPSLFLRVSLSITHDA